jgi:hypothetical protein
MQNAKKLAIYNSKIVPRGTYQAILNADGAAMREKADARWPRLKSPH